jgi:hypothetical protein
VQKQRVNAKREAKQNKISDFIIHNLKVIELGLSY